jgi:hypothetical protein
VPSFLGEARHVGGRDGVMGWEDRYTGFHAVKPRRPGQPPDGSRPACLPCYAAQNGEACGMDYVIAGLLLIFIVGMLVALKRYERRRQ